MLYIVHHYYHNHDKVDCVCKLNMDALKIVLVENIQLLYKLLSQLLFQDVTYEKNNLTLNIYYSLGNSTWDFNSYSNSGFNLLTSLNWIKTL